MAERDELLRRAQRGIVLERAQAATPPPIPQPQSAPVPEIDVKPFLGPKLSTALQGTSLGFSDELTAAARSTFGDPSFPQALQAERQQLQGFREENPIGAVGLEVAGAIPTAFLPLGLAFKAVQAARGVRAGIQGTRLGKIGVTAVLGAVEGALAGFGVGEGDGETLGSELASMNRLETAITGAGVGGIAGAGLASIQQIAPTVWRTLSRSLSRPSPRKQARELIREALDADGVTAKQVIDLLDQSPRQGLETAADIAGPETRALADVAFQVPGASRATSRRFLDARAGGAGQRIKQDAARLLGATDDYFDTIDSIAARQRATANQLYDNAYYVGGDPQQGLRMIPTDEIADLMGDPQFQRAYRQGVEIFEREQRLLGNPVPPRIDFGNVLPDEIPVHVLDIVKRGTDRSIGRAIRAEGGGPLNRSLTMFKRELVDRADALAPEYGAARAAFAGDAALLNAAEEGRKVLRKNPGELSRELADMTPSEVDSFTLGAMDALSDAIDRGKDGIDQARRHFGTPRARALWRRVFPDGDSFDEFLSGVEREGDFSITRNRLTAGSSTAPRLLGSERLTVARPPTTPSGIVDQTLGFLLEPPTELRGQVADEITRALSLPQFQGAAFPPTTQPAGQAIGRLLMQGAGATAATAPRTLALERNRKR